MNDIIFRVIVPDNKILFKTLMIKGERGLQGTSIVSIEKTQTIGLTDYYTISLNDGTTYEFTVQNGTNSYFDDEFSLVSENAVQNKVITAAINAINAALVSIQQYDNALSLSSENAVQNKVVAAAIDSINSALALLGQYDSALSGSSENAVQNKVVKAALDLKANLTALNNYYTKTEVDGAFNNLGASNVGYNNASSGLSATDSQAAIDELKTITDGKANILSLNNFTLNSVNFTNENPSNRLFQINLDVSSTGLPYTKINLAFSPNGFKCAGYSNNVWTEFWNYNKIDTYNHTAALKEGETVQIPQAVLNHKLILIKIWRYGYFGSILLDRADIVDGHATAGVYVWVYTGAKHFTISSAGVITAGTGFGTDGQWVGLIGIG